MGAIVVVLIVILLLLRLKSSLGLSCCQLAGWISHLLPMTGVILSSPQGPPPCSSQPAHPSFTFYCTAAAVRWYTLLCTHCVPGTMAAPQQQQQHYHMTPGLRAWGLWWQQHQMQVRSYSRPIAAAIFAAASRTANAFAADESHIHNLFVLVYQ